MAAQPDVSLRLLDAGDSAVTLEFGNRVAPDLVARVAAAEHALDAARARGREVLTDDSSLGDGAFEPSVLDDLAEAEDGARLRDCLARLDAKPREGILLAFVHGLSHPEVAERLATPLGTVKSWIRRGLLTLRECLS